MILSRGSNKDKRRAVNDKANTSIGLKKKEFGSDEAHRNRFTLIGSCQGCFVSAIIYDFVPNTRIAKKRRNLLKDFSAKALYKLKSGLLGEKG